MKFLIILFALLPALTLLPLLTGCDVEQCPDSESIPGEVVCHDDYSGTTRCYQVYYCGNE